MKAVHIKKATLDWPDLWEHLSIRKDKGGRWYPSENTPESVRTYLEENYRSPSRAWPNSYATACLTQKFAKFLCTNEPKIAIACKVGTPSNSF